MMILIPDRIIDPDIEREVFGPGVEIVTCNAMSAGDIPDNTWRRADGILAWHEIEYTAEVIGKLRPRGAIVRVGVGYDNIDLEAARQRGITVCNVPDYGVTDVADHTMALLLALARGLFAYEDHARAGGNSWQAAGILQRLGGPELSKLGIIGLGRIGTAVAQRARAFDLTPLCHDPYIPDGRARSLGVRRLDELDEMLAQSDAITFHAPLTNETRGLANRRFFEHLKTGCLLVNTSRGDVINLDALSDAMISGNVRAAGLDVLPAGADSHHLIRAWRDRQEWIKGRLIITPHCAFYNADSYREMRLKAAQELKRILNGREPRNRIA